MIKKWVLKAIVQKTISYLPGSHRLNFFFQKYVTKGVQLSEDYFEDRLIHASKHLHFFGKYAKTDLNTTLELGTGWYPVVPISLFLSGAKEIHTADISALCNKSNLETTIGRFLQYHSQKRLDPYFKPAVERMVQLKKLHENSPRMTFQEMLDELRIRYLVGDIRKHTLSDGSIDLIHSNNTFEHVYPEVLKSILSCFRKLGSKKGVMSHFIDMSDHFAHFDRSITIYNFLKYSDRTWNLIDNTIQPQNRWRLSEYKELYKELDIDITEVAFRAGSIATVQSLKLAPKYDAFDPEDLAISHCYVISAL